MKKTILSLMVLLSTTAVYSQKMNDMVQLDRYHDDNLKLLLKSKESPSEFIQAVFIGNSITEGWVYQDSDFFADNNFVGRGISGQTSTQLLLRFRQDVIDLSPIYVVINVGTNDIAENTGAYDEDFTFKNIESMVDLALYNDIEPILSSVLPITSFGWNDKIENISQKVESLNIRIKALAELKGLSYIDYYTPMVDQNKGLNIQYGDDGVHPNLQGYKVMEQVVMLLF